MPVDYAKLTVEGVCSTSSDYSNPKSRFSPAIFAVTPDEYLHMEIEADTGGGTTITTTSLGSASMLAVKNGDATNYVTATFRSAGNSSVDNIVRIAAGGLLVVTDFTVANNLVLAANSSVCECEVFLVGT